jgi:hypothetical protein
MPGVWDIDVPGEPLLDGAEGVHTGPSEIRVSALAGGFVMGRVTDETGAPLAQATVVARVAGSRSDGRWTRTGADGTFRIERLDPSAVHVVTAGFSAPTRGLEADRAIEDVKPGTTDLEFRIDTGPRVAVSVDFRDRRSADGPRPVRIVRADAPNEKPDRNVEEKVEFRWGPERVVHVLWRAAPAGRWLVLAHVTDVDERGEPMTRWIELGGVETGETERNFVVPK